ncbi:hypothetical protein [Reyranella sp.]|nr:hypothetical protein [Reyranella sp.]MDP2376600.1 hypothetical protein [Reyranella sp.]
MMGILDGKTCIVTGAAGSLGLASARRFAEEGARSCWSIAIALASTPP